MDGPSYVTLGNGVTNLQVSRYDENGDGNINWGCAFLLFCSCPDEYHMDFEFSVPSNTILNLEDFKTLTVTYSKEQDVCKIFVDGELVASKNGLPDCDNLLQLEGLTANTAQVKNIKIYNRALTEAEVQQNVDAINGNSENGLEGSLIRYYDAANNTGSGHSSTTTTWKDLTGNHDIAIPESVEFESDYLYIDSDNLYLEDINDLSEFTLEMKVDIEGEMELWDSAGFRTFVLYDDMNDECQWNLNYYCIHEGSHDDSNWGDFNFFDCMGGFKTITITGSKSSESVYVYIDGELSSWLNMGGPGRIV